MIRMMDRKKANSKEPSSPGSRVIPSETDSQLSVSLSDLSCSAKNKLDSEGRGDASTDDDVSHLFNHSVDSQDDFLVDIKRRD